MEACAREGLNIKAFGGPLIHNHVPICAEEQVIWIMLAQSDIPKM